MEDTNSKVDFKAREYQVEILETAIKRNTIVFMPTGSGKTYIAAMLIKHMAKEIEKPYSEGGKRTFFLVNTVALVSQQANSVASLLPLEVSTYSGDMGVDYWDRNRWHQELEKNQVLVMTAQIFLNLLTHAYIQMSRVNLLIMDECHHTMHNHSMNQIMKIYRLDCSERPRILGLTATLLNANCKIERIDSEIKTLETNMDSIVITATDEELVQKYSTNPKEKIVRYSSQAFTLGRQLLQTCVTSLKKAINSINLIEPPIISPVVGAELLSDSKKTIKKKLLNLLQNIDVLYDDLGLYAAAECALALIVRLERLKLSTTDTVLSTLLEIMITKLHYFRNRAYKLMNGNDDATNNTVPLVYSSAKLQKLCEFFKNYEPENVAIVFVERRLTAKVLFYVFNILSKTNSMYKGIRPEFIVGFNNNPYNDTREVLYLKKSNLATLRKFNCKEVNVLFASNVIEEGIDIRLCNYVIKLDLPQTFRSYIQSKGRARNKNSIFLLFMPEEVTKELSNYNLFKATEEYMKEKLQGGKAMGYLQSKEHGNEDEDCNLPPYFADGPGSAMVTGISAISLINRYCMSLPQDRFCSLTSYWFVKEINIDCLNKYQGILQLPVNSAIKNLIEGPLCDSKMNAKRGVALEACKLLHCHGELDSNLLPCGKNSELLSDKKLFPHWQLHESKAGSKKLRRNYDKHYSKWELKCRPRPKLETYFHFIRISPNYEKPLRTRLAAFYELLNSKQSFSIATSIKWPKLCKFSMFMNVGEVNIQILENVETIKLSINEINLLFRFHCLLFAEVLKITKKFVMRDYENLENSFFLVPTIEGENGKIFIDWETIKKHEKLPELKPLSNKGRENLVVDEETYLNKVVVPWYRHQGDSMRYIVTKVCSDEKPDSPFPSANYESYAQYFFQRYNQKLLNLSQPLIEVRAISSKLNLLLPKGKKQSSRQKRLEGDDFEETLIPELCCLLEFPSVYMLKATVLPSVLHRIHHLLIAEELRQRIALETKLGSVHISSEMFLSEKTLDGNKPPRKRRKLDCCKPTVSIGTEDHIWESLKVDQSAIQYDDKSQAHSTIEVSDMLTSNMNALKEGIFPWKEEDEPFDVERQLQNIDLLAIIHYQKFMSVDIELQSATTNGNNLLNELTVVNTPPKAFLSILNDKDNSIGPEQQVILQALTAVSATDIINYERLETLGDSFLKFIVSLALFIYYPDKDEGKLTQVKGKIIGNKNFFFVGSNILLGSLLKVNDFSPSDWDVPCFNISRDFKNIIKHFRFSPNLMYQIGLSPLERDSGILNEETRLKLHELINKAEENDETSHSSWAIIGQHSVSDKTISDAVEALVGVYLQACGIEGAVTLCQWLGILAQEISDVTQLFNSPAPTAQFNACLDVDCLLVEHQRLEATIGYKFKDRSFLLQALTHASYQNNITDCYQRFEFLGDAILDFLITAHIYENCGNLSPGELTDLRSALVNNVTFACLSVRYGFHRYLNARSSKLNELVLRFVKHQESRDHKIGAEVLFLIEEQNAQVAESVDVPKLLGDLFESIAAAIYLDSGKNLQLVWNVYFNLMKKEIEDFSKTVPKNHIRLLYEKFPFPPPKFGSAKILLDDGRVLVPLEVIHNTKPSVFHGIGENKHQAKLAAAKMALRFFHEKYQDV
ncbi:endoribonuclease Dcr-2 isoform X2 [Rhodnius prolixus]|uniref:endoribonuclease Dcr-2 isoform X2 n=1 Tax=Rhodnius prolixus TaxID=13249 RepID=UPI003D18B123